MRGLVLVAILLASILTAGCVDTLASIGSKDCGADANCLVEAARNCQFAVANIPTYGTTLRAEVKGCDGDKVNYRLSAPTGALNCKIPKQYIGGTFSNINIGEFCTTEGATPAPTAAPTATPTPAPTATPRPPVAAGPQMTFTPIADDWAWSYQPDVNRHFDYNLDSRYKQMNGERAEPILMFDLSSLAGKDIASAALRLYSNGIQTRGEERSIYSAADDAFIEGQVTWHSSPQSESKLDTETISAASAWYSWDVTDFVKQKAGNKATFRMVTDGGYYGDNSIGFDGREKDNAPELVVTLAGAAPPATKTAAIFAFDYAGSSNSGSTYNAAAIAKERLESAGYDVELYQNKNAAEAVTLMDGKNVIAIFGHGVYDAQSSVAPAGGGMVFFDGSGESYLMPFEDPTRNSYSIAKAYLGNTELVAFIGCDTSENSELRGSLINAVVNSGAKAAIGFGKPIYMDSEMDKFSSAFFGELAGGKTVGDAAGTAKNAANSVCSTPGLDVLAGLSDWIRNLLGQQSAGCGYQSAVIEGDAGTRLA